MSREVPELVLSIDAKTGAFEILNRSQGVLYIEVRGVPDVDPKEPYQFNVGSSFFYKGKADAQLPR